MQIKKIPRLPSGYCIKKLLKFYFRRRMHTYPKTVNPPIKAYVDGSGMISKDGTPPMFAPAKVAFTSRASARS